MDSNDISDISEKVEQAIKCAKKLLTPLGDGLHQSFSCFISNLSKDVVNSKYSEIFGIFFCD